ncbi:MAG: glycosyltransferase family 2 protein [Paludibacteraceae bacterium]|nr:glycosyltransferase family 2 protein [Paludibacteraceae bacterium]
MILSIVVINYRQETLTIRFVKNELSKIQMPHKTVIVNNSATEESNRSLCDELNAMLVEKDDIDVDTNNDIFVLPSTDNLGFAKGNNLGAKFCKKWFAPQYILFTNNDILLKNDDIAEKLIQKLEEHSDAGMIGPKVIGLDGNLQSPFPYTPYWKRHIWMYWSTLFYSAEKKKRMFQFDYQERAQEGYHYYVMGSFFLVKTEDFYKCGMFDPHTFLYAEEPILAERMAAIGKLVYYYPNCEVIHEHGVTTSKFAKSKRVDWQLESENYYYRTYKHTGWFLIFLGTITHRFLRLKNIIQKEQMKG